MAGGMRPRDGASGRWGTRRRARRFSLEALEDRTAPAVWSISSGAASDLAAAIREANTNGDASNTINLAGTYTLSVADNDWFGPTGLPVITSNLTIQGSSTNGAAIVRSGAQGTPDFRLLDVGGGQLGEAYGTLTLRNLTLANGKASGGDSGTGGGGLGAGGAIFSMGSLTLDGVTVAGNRAMGGGSGETAGADGGGMGSGGLLGDFGIGGASGDPDGGPGGFGAGGGGAATGTGGLGGWGAGDGGDGPAGGGGGGAGMGGAVFNFTGSLTVLNSTIAFNQAVGGVAGAGGSAGGGYGGGVFNLNGSVILVNATFAGNAADTDGLDLSSLAFGREWRTDGGFVAGSPVSASVSLANSLLASSASAGSALATQADGSSLSTGPGGDDSATVDAAMLGAGSPSSAVRGVAGSITSGSLEMTAIPTLDPAGLQDHGGPTQTIALTGSRLAGLVPGTVVYGLPVPAVDQRGATRPDVVGGDVGAFQVTSTPTATLASAPPANAAVSTATTTTVSVTYADQSGLGLDPSSFGDDDITVANGATVTGYSVAGSTVTYTITAPTASGVTWGDAPQGAYEVSVVAGAVKDLAGGSIAATDLGSFMVDVVPPTATLNSSPMIGGSSGGLNTQTLMVIYNDRGAGIDPATFGLGNLTVGNGATVTGYSVASNVVYYTVTAPAATWAASVQGLYAVTLVGGSVKDLAGNPIAAVASFGAFRVDTVPPTATLTAAPAVNAATPTKTTTVTITYADNNSLVSPLTFLRSNISVNNGATVTNVSYTGNAVTYTITAPAATWAASPQGAYTISLATTVKDFAGNAVAAVADFGSFMVDTIAPTAALTSAPVVNAATPGNTSTVSVTYDGGVSGLNAGSVAKGNITVSNGAKVTGFAVSGNVVTYTITAPEATWTASPQGTYTIAVVGGSVKDGAGNPIAAVAKLGSFLVDTTPPTATLTSAPKVDASSAGLATTTVDVTFEDGISGLDPSTLGVGNITVANGATVTGYSVAGKVVTYTITAPAATWAASPQGSYHITLVAGGVKDLAGNPITGPLDLGSFDVSAATVTAQIVAAPTVTAASVDSNVTTVAIAFDGGSSGLDSSSLGVGNIAVGNGAMVTGYSVSGSIVTYTVAAPALTWGLSPQGAYTISIVAGSVKAGDGSPIAGTPGLGSFLVDTVPPTASLDTAPTLTSTEAATDTTTVVVTFTDAAAGLDLSTFGVGNIVVGNGATVTGFSVAGNVVTYTITAPGASWASSQQGTYAVSLVAGTVKDLAGNGVAGTSLGSFVVDTAAPTAALTSAPTVNAATSPSTTTITVTYADATTGLDASTFGVGNIVVGNGATVTSFSVSGNVVSYTITAPESTWSTSPQGAYSIALAAASVKDLAGNPVAGASLGSFVVDTSPPTAALTSAPMVDAARGGAGTTTIVVTYADGTTGIDPSSLGVDDIAVGSGATVASCVVAGNVVTYTIAAPAATWGQSAQGSYSVSLLAGAVRDLAGNPIAGVALGVFVVDTSPPTATLAAAPVVGASAAGLATTTVTLDFADATSGLDTSTFGVGNLVVGNGATVTGYSVSGTAVTYTITAPAATWAASPQGAYSISLAAGSVKDLAGNPIAAAGLGSFEVDTAPPTASLASAPTVDVSSAGRATTTVVVSYADATSGMDPSTLGVDDIAVNNGATVTGYSVSGTAVTYTITAPASTWAASPQGAYVVSLVAGAVKDLAGNGVAGATLGSFVVDTVSPTATLVAAPTVKAAAAGGATTSVTVAYADATSGVDPSTFGVGNIAVNNGATVTGYSGSGNTVTYTIAAPASTWAASPQGAYAVALVGNSVRDRAGNAVAAASLGSFVVDTAAPTATVTAASTVNAAQAVSRTMTVAVTYADATSGVDPSAFGVGNIAVSNGATVTGYSAFGNVVTYTIAAPAASWAASPQGVYSISLTSAVRDLAGNSVLAGTVIGSFMVDTVAPTATLTSAPTVNAASPSTTTVTITFADATSGIDPLTLRPDDLAVSNGATVIGCSAVGVVATYTIKAPTGTWATSPQGPYTISLVAGTVKDLAGNAAAAVLGSLLVDTAPPTATLSSSPRIDIAGAGASSTTVSVTYADAVAGIDASTFGVGNLVVGNGATVTGYSAVGGVVTYTIRAPGASWSAGPQGSYAIALVAGSVKDLAGNAVAAASLGAFVVDLTRWPATSTLAGAPGATTFGQPIRLTATVSAASGSSRPGGTVTFREGTTTLAQAAVGADGTASVSLATGLAVGSHAIVANYGGDPLFGPVDSAAFTIVVGKAAPQAGAVAASSTSVYQGQGVTLAATFQAASDGATPMTGTVGFYDGATYLGSAAIGSTNAGAVVTGHAAFATSALAVGSHSFRAVYSGDGSYAAATADPVAVTAAPVTTAVTLAASTSGQSATLTASVVVTSPGQASLGGVVNFYDNGSLVGSVPLSGGAASLALSGLAAGTHSFAAAYAGGQGISAASSTSVGAAIAPLPPKVVGVVIQTVKRKPPVVVVTFDKAVDPAAAANAARYAVIGPIVGKKPGKAVRVTSASYNASSNAVTLSFKAKLTPQKSYRLTIADLGFTAVFKGSGIVGR